MKKNMKSFVRITSISLALSMTIALCGCGDKDSGKKNLLHKDTESTEVTGTVASDSPNEEFEDYMTELFVDFASQDTITLHFTIKDPSVYGLDDYEVTWGENPFDDKAIKEDIEDSQEILDKLDTFDYSELDENQQLTYDILKEQQQENIESYDYLDYYEPFAYTSGVQSNFTLNMAEYTFYSEKDVTEYLELLEELPAYMDYYLDFEKQRSENGYFMSDTSADNVIEQCNSFTEKTEDNYLIQTFNNRIDKLKLDKDTAKEYKEKNVSLVTKNIIPEYEKIAAEFEKMKGTGTNENGLCYYDKGKDYYEFLLRSKIGTDKTPEEVIDTLEDAIDATYQNLMMSVYSDMDTYDNYINSKYSFPSTDPTDILSSLQLASAKSFPAVKGMNYDVVYVDESLEDSLSPAFCFSPCVDDYLNNNIYINGGSTDESTIWSTLCHEGYPGHLYQFAYFYSTKPSPIRTSFNYDGYTEGWAEYVEMQSYDWAISDDFSDSMADIAEMNSRLNLLVSARLEIGVNYEGWTLDECADYLNDNGFNGDAASDIFDYVVAEPANYQMYCIGMLTFEELKESAEDVLGTNFDLIKFHEAVLSTGACPFSLLKDVVNEYITENQTQY